MQRQQPGSGAALTALKEDTRRVYPYMKADLTETRKIQNKLLEILLYFQQFCEAHELGFVLAGGTCLGAVRHQGFIPWDDDVDVFMLREDYERLGPLWERFADTERYACVRSNEQYNIHHTATEIKDSNTTFINRHSVDLDIHQGLMIDVIPLDAVADGGLARLMQVAHGMLYCCFNFQRLPEHKGKIFYYMTKAALGLVRSPKVRYRIWRHEEKRLSRYAVAEHALVASFGEGLGIMRQRFPKEWFLHPGTALFEGHPMPVPADTDAYLRISYGDYEKLPPAEEQIPRHDTVFMDLEHGYRQYRGIRYCVKK